MNKYNPTATWYIRLNVDCPHCNDYVNLLDYPDFWDGVKFGPCEHDTERTRNVEVMCPNCEETFYVDFIL